MVPQGVQSTVRNGVCRTGAEVLAFRFGFGEGCVWLTCVECGLLGVWVSEGESWYVVVVFCVLCVCVCVCT